MAELGNDRQVVYRTCHLCEATCGLELHLDRAGDIALVRGDRDDVFSHGYLCPKGTALKGLEADPDRIRAPQLRRGDQWFDVSWDDAFAEIDANLTRIIDEHGRDAVALYLGNPNAHNLAGLVYNRVLIQSLHTKNVYSASTVDQMPKQVSAGLMFGAALSIPVPDVDRTDYLLMLGANPFASNGSLMTAADIPGRLRALRERGGRLVVVDPRRTKTAEEASEHLFIRPGTDAHFLIGIVHTLFADDLVDFGTVGAHVNGADVVASVAHEFSPEVVAPVCGIDAPVIRRIAHELAGAPRAAVYGRIGTCTHEFGTLASWLVDVINVCTGNLDRPGGAMFTLPASGGANTGGPGGRGRGVKFGRRASRVRQVPEFFGELPVVCLAEEIDTPGAGQVRALITVAGNPALSNPDARRMDRALAGLDFMVSVDIYRNETTRYANVILPPERELARGHYDLALYSLAIRNIANYSPPVVECAANEMPEWQTLLRLSAIVAGEGPMPTSTRSTSSWSPGLRRSPSVAPARTSKAVTRKRCSARSHRDAGPNGSSISCCVPGRTATGSARTPTVSPSRSSKRTRTASTSDRCSRAFPRCCARRRVRSNSRRRRSSPTSNDCARRSPRRPAPRCGWWVGATSARTIRGCTTSTCS